MFYDYEFKHYNIRLILYMTALNILGILVIRSATNLNETMVSKQILGVLIGMAVAVGLSLVDYHRILNLSAVIYIICFLSRVVGGAGLGSSEVDNPEALDRSAGDRPASAIGICQNRPDCFLLLVFYEIPGADQPAVGDRGGGAAVCAARLPAGFRPATDLSTSLVMVIMVAGIVFASGISYRWIAGTLAVVLPVTGTFIYLLLNGLIPFIREYQAGRILAWFNPEKYGQAYYQQANSIIAIGSGQLNGKGLYNTTIASVKNGNFLSEEQTDFIFAVIGEELGFIGCMAVIILFLLIIYECLIMAARARDLGGRLICAGMATLIAFQAFANIAVATAIFPNTGLPLPFISFGSSSLISIFIGMGLVLNVGLQRETRH